MARTDIHRPTVIIPEDYRFVAFEHIKSSGDVMGDALLNGENKRRIRADMERTGGTYSRHDHGGKCGICGNANAMYTALFHHAPTNTYIRTGQDCCEKLDAGVNFNKFIEGVKAEEAFRAGKKKAAATLIAEGLEAAWPIYSLAYDDLPKNARGEQYFEERTIQDIVAKLVRYGSISEKQTAFVRKLLDAIPARAPKEAARQAEKDAAKPLPVSDKRMTIRGTVLSVKLTEGPYGDVTKILVQHADGWKVWGSMPSIPVIVQVEGRSEMSYVAIDKGDEIQFDAKVQVSKDDPKFGFYKRPTKAQNFTKAQEKLA